ncbi:MAG: hypothetical protein KG003_12085 [Bacteroidetes bacterium]|nr:hypothetical protein [Bacteroidota bacterium]
MENAEIYQWLDRDFEQLSAEEQAVVLHEMDAETYNELHALHGLSLNEGAVHLEAAESIVIPPLVVPKKTIFIARRIPYWAAAASVLLAILGTRYFWVKQVPVPNEVVQIIHDTVRLRDVVQVVKTDTVILPVVQKSTYKMPVSVKRKAGVNRTVSDLGPDIGEVRGGVREQTSLPSSQRSMAENVLLKEVRYVKM